MSHLSLLLHPTTVPRARAVPGQLIQFLPFIQHLLRSTSTGADGHFFALHHYLTPCMGTREGKKRRETTSGLAGRSSFLYLSNPFCPAGITPLLPTVPQGSAILSSQRKSNFRVFSVRQHERRFCLLIHHTASHICLPPDHLEITLIHYISNQ